MKSAGLLFREIIFHQLNKSVKEKVCVVGATAGFRVKLNAKGRNVLIGNSFAGSVVAVYKRFFCKGRETFAFYSVTVILTCNENPSAL